jgi:hypothetical protein
MPRDHIPNATTLELQWKVDKAQLNALRVWGCHSNHSKKHGSVITELFRVGHRWRRACCCCCRNKRGSVALPVIDNSNTTGMARKVRPLRPSPRIPPFEAMI